MNLVLQAARSQAGVLAELTKLRIQGVAIPAALAAQWLAQGERLLPGPALALSAGLFLTCSGAACLNQVLEADTDALMERTRSRPIPSGRVRRESALVFGLLACALGVSWFSWMVGPLAAWLALAMVVLYDFVYTPLKRITPLNTAVGAVPGALPVLIGWAAAGKGLDPVAWTLFGILFLWQFPHFMAIAWLHREDYERAGLRMVTARGIARRVSGQRALSYALALVPVSLLPTLNGGAGRLYFYGALVLSLLFLLFALRFSLAVQTPEGTPAPRARGLLHASLLYLPLLFALLIADSAMAASP